MSKIWEPKLSQIKKVVKSKEGGLFRKKEFLVVFAWVPDDPTRKDDPKAKGALTQFKRPIEEHEFWKSKIGQWIEYDPKKQYKPEE